MDIYQERFTNLQNSILGLLCLKSGKKFNQRELSQMLKVSPTAIAKSLPLLVEYELIKIEKIGKINLKQIYFDRDSVKADRFKKWKNLQFFYDCGVLDYLEEKCPGCTIILFGSFARGEDTFNSDIDIAIIGCARKKMDLSKFELKILHEINVNFYNSLSKIDKGLKENILQGITVFGGIEL